MDVLDAAAGIQRIVDMRMADEVRVFAAKRGVDLSAFTLLPFGGAGAVHAAAVAEELGMRRILVPPRPGAFSALGLLCTDVVHDYIRSELRPLDRGHAPITPRTFSANWRRRRARSSQPRAWTPPPRASCANLICATPARVTNCARRSTALFSGAADGGSRWPQRASGSTSATRKFTAMPPRSARSRW